MSKCKECEGTGIIEIIDYTNPDYTCQLCYGRGDVEYTCDNCDIKDTCKFAFDAYNTNGDCVAEK